MNISSNNFGNTGFKVRRQNFSIGSLIFLILFGAVFTGVGLAIYKSTQTDDSWTRVQGEVASVSSRISEGSTLYTPVVSYEANGKAYQVAGNGGSSSYPNIGDKREVAYNPTRPDQSKVVESAGSKMFILIFPAVGIAMLILAPILFIKSLQRSSRIKNLVRTGQKVRGVLVDIQTNSGNNNNHTYNIVVSAADNSGGVQNYTSDSLSGIAGLAMADFRNNPIPIDVYIDPTNTQNYYVDVSDIPNLTPQRISELIKSAVSSTQPNTIVQGQAPPPIVQQPPNMPTFPPSLPPTDRPS